MKTIYAKINARISEINELLRENANEKGYILKPQTFEGLSAKEIIAVYNDILENDCKIKFVDDDNEFIIINDFINENKEYEDFGNYFTTFLSETYTTPNFFEAMGKVEKDSNFNEKLEEFTENSIVDENCDLDEALKDIDDALIEIIDKIQQSKFFDKILKAIH